jgi:apolipoprotein N-acyltransferase
MRRKEVEMKAHPADEEKRSAVRWLIAGVIFLVAMLGMWWLVEATNEEGTHDAELLPLFAFIPLLIGTYHLVRSRSHHG